MLQRRPDWDPLRLRLRLRLRWRRGLGEGERGGGECPPLEDKGDRDRDRDRGEAGDSAEAVRGLGALAAGGPPQATHRRGGNQVGSTCAVWWGFLGSTGGQGRR